MNAIEEHCDCCEFNKMFKVFLCGAQLTQVTMTASQSTYPDLFVFSNALNSALIYYGIAVVVFLSLYHILLFSRCFRAAMIVFWALFLVSLPLSLIWMLSHFLLTIQLSEVYVYEYDSLFPRTTRVGLNGLFYYRWNDFMGKLTLLNLFPIITLVVSIYLSFNNDINERTLSISLIVMSSLNGLIFLVIWGILVVITVIREMADTFSKICGLICCFPIFVLIGNLFAVLFGIATLMKAFDVVVLFLLRAKDPLIGKDLCFPHSEALKTLAKERRDNTMRMQLEKRSKQQTKSQQQRLRHLVALFEDERRDILIEKLQQMDIVKIILDYVYLSDGTDVLTAWNDGKVVVKIHDIVRWRVISYEPYSCTFD